MRLNLFFAALAAAYALSACGGGYAGDAALDAAPAQEQARHHAVTPAGEIVAVWLDAADDEDIAAAKAMPHLFTIEPFGVLVGATTPSTVAVRLWAADWLGVDSFHIQAQEHEHGHERGQDSGHEVQR